MEEEQKDVEAPEEVSRPKAKAKAPRLTLQVFADRVNQLIDEAIAEDLRPLPVLATILAKRGMGLFDQTRASVAEAIERSLDYLERGHAKAEKK